MVALLGGCRIHCDAELASDVAQKLAVELDLDHAADRSRIFVERDPSLFQYYL